MIQQFYFWIFNPKELKSASEKDTYIPMFIAVLLTISKRWKQPKYLLTNGLRNAVYTYKGILFGFKKKDSLPFPTSYMDWGIIMLNEVSKTQNDKYCMMLEGHKIPVIR